MPQISLVSKTGNRADLGGAANGVLTHLPVASNSKPWNGQTSRPPHIPAGGRFQVGTQVRTDGLRDANPPIIIICLITTCDLLRFVFQLEEG